MAACYAEPRSPWRPPARPAGPPPEQLSDLHPDWSSLAVLLLRASLGCAAVVPTWFLSFCSAGDPSRLFFSICQVVSPPLLRILGRTPDGQGKIRSPPLTLHSLILCEPSRLTSPCKSCSRLSVDTALVNTSPYLPFLLFATSPRLPPLRLVSACAPSGSTWALPALRHPSWHHSWGDVPLSYCPISPRAGPSVQVALYLLTYFSFYLSHLRDLCVICASQTHTAVSDT